MRTNATVNCNRWIGILPLILMLGFAATAANAQSLSKVFSPNTIGPGSVSTITFTISNDGGTPITNLAFTDVLPTVPGDMDIATPANASTTCLNGVVTAPDGGSTITFSDGDLGGGASCTVTVDVTAGTPGVHTNPAVTLIFDELDGDPPSSSPVDLTVDTSLPGFSKSFSPSTVSLGSRSTLTLTIDNSGNDSQVNDLDFTDNLPTGMVIANPAKASTTCGTTLIPPTLTATAGTSVITLDANGFGSFPAVAAGTTCTVTVDVVTTSGGSLVNVTELLASFVSAGKASAALEVTVTPISLIKEFTDDPTPPGATVTLDFTINNFDRFDAATGIAFTDDLTTALAGLTFDSLLANDCGGSVLGVGTTTITFTGGTLGPETSCTISVSLTVPPGATPGDYTNTTGAITATVGGSPETGNMASDVLFVSPAPILTKEFLEVGTLAPNPVVNPGDDVVLRFTVTNTSTTSGATDITFFDELTDGGPGTGFLPFPVTVALPPVPDPPCGAGSSLALTFFDTDRQRLELTDGSLDPAPGASSTCTFEVTLTIPATFPAGTYTNTTEEITATVDGATRTGAPASDDLDVITAPTLVKEFTDDPVQPGGTVTLEFTLTHDSENPSDATAIGFIDDLTLMGIPGLASISGTVTDVCGAGSQISGTTSLALTGGTLAPDESCTFSVTLDVPAGAPRGTFTNTTGTVMATVGGTAITGNTATGDLLIPALLFSKEFLDSPMIPGATGTLRFTIDNVGPDPATITFFTDNLAANLPGLAATGGATVNTCGGALSGTTFLTYTGGSVAAMTSCTIEVPILVPAGAADGTYANITSSLAAVVGDPITIDPAVDNLVVDGDLLQLTKAFTDDPAMPGGTVNLRFTLTNLDTVNPASAVAFSDDLDAVLSGLVATGLPVSGCGGTAATSDGGMTIDFTGGSLTAGETCFFDVSVTVPAGATSNTYTNTTSGVTGTITGLGVAGDPATDNLVVTTTDVAFTKAFDGPTTATGTPVLTFTITNLDATNGLLNLSFSDNLDAVISGLEATGLPLMNICGAGSKIVGTGLLSFTGGNLAPSGSCTFDVPLMVPETATAGTFPNTTSELFDSGIPVADPATADLTVEPPPTFAKVFDPDAILFQGLSTLTFTIDNTASALDATSLDFTDNLPAGVEVAGTPNASTTCTGGTLTADAGTGVIAYTGGTVGAGASCTVTVDVTGIAGGTHVNTTGDLTSSSGNSGTASDTVTVEDPPVITAEKADDGDAAPGDAVAYTVTITNSGGGASDVVFSDTVDGNTTLDCTTNTPTTTQGTVTTCDDTTGEVTVDVGTLAASTSVTITFEAMVNDPIAAGLEEVCNQGTVSSSNTSDVLTDDPDTGDPDDATCVIIDAAPDLVLTKDDGGATVMPGNDVVYTLIYENTGNQDATGVEITETVPDNTTFNAGASTAGWTCTPDATAGSTCTLAVGDVAAGAGSAAATFTVTVDNPVPAGTTEITNDASVADDGTNGADPTPLDNTDSDTTPIDAMPEVMAQKTDALTNDVDDDSNADPGDTITYTVVITNNGDEDATAVVFTDLASDHLNATLVAGSVTTSQGTVDSGNGAGDTDVSVSVGMVAGGGGTATITFEVTVDGPLAAGIEEVCNQGLVTDNFPDLLTDDPDTGTADDPTCTPVDAAPDLTLTKDDGDATATPGDDIPYTLTYENVGNQDATGVEITETVPVNTTFNAAASTAGWTCTPDATAGSTCTLLVGALAAGAGPSTATFTVTVDNPVPAGTTEVTNAASIADDEANGTDPTPGDNSDTDTTPVDAAANVSATKTDALVVDNDGDGQADPGDTIGYTIMISNTGDEGADTVVLTDTPGVNTTLVVGSVVAPGGTIIQGNTAGDTMVEVSFPMIDGEPSAPATGTVTFRVVVDVPFPAGVATVSNQGSVDFLNARHQVALAILTDDPDTPAPNDPTVTQIDRESDLALTKTVDNPTPPAFSNVVFTVTLRNLGAISNGVIVRDLLPEGLTFISADPAIDFKAPTGEWKINPIAAGDSSILRITARVDVFTPRTNTAEITETLFPDPDESNNSASATVTPTIGLKSKEETAEFTVQEAESVPVEFELSPNYPNPFNTETVIPIGIPEASQVVVSIYDLLGRHVAELVNGTLSAGWHRVTWHTADQPTGIYFVRMQAGSVVKTRRVTLLR